MNQLPAFLYSVARALYPNSSSGQRYVRARDSVVGIVALVGATCFVAAQVRANGENSPTGTAKPLSQAELIRSACSYNAYTGSTTRTVTDLVVPGGIGKYPLVFSRSSTSRFVPGDDNDSRTFGPSGCWRHSYRWGLYLDNPGSSPSVWRVHYPDGMVVRFAVMPAPAAPTSGGAAPAPDPYMRCVSPGVHDRLAATGNDFNLHLADGGTVYFTCQTDGMYNATSITDPYKQVTNLTYFTTGLDKDKLQTVTEPGGRLLTLTYGPCNNIRVITNVTASNGQSVTYGYSTITVGGASFSALSSVTYNSDPDPRSNSNPQAPCQATYTYQADNTGANLRPLLLRCVDPHFDGPMPKIHYAFTQGSSIPYGQIQSEINDASDGTTPAVSTYNASNQSETNGEGSTSGYSYYGYLVNSIQDYEGASTGLAYDANSYLNSVTSRNGQATTITRDPYVGKKLSVSTTDTNG